MQMKSLYRWSLALALSGALLASPAAAQAKGKENGKGRTRPELVRRKGVPPGWCQGKGNPHNTPENCGYDAARRDDRTVPLRHDDRARRGSASYERAHAEFHRVHDRECRMRAAERPLDIGWQLRVRQECRERHEDWHDHMGRDHS